MFHVKPASVRASSRAKREDEDQDAHRRHRGPAALVADASTASHRRRLPHRCGVVGWARAAFDRS
jgi:hypothetical protein